MWAFMLEERQIEVLIQTEAKAVVLSCGAHHRIRRQKRQPEAVFSTSIQEQNIDYSVNKTVPM